jgi:hypothetical protein
MKEKTPRTIEDLSSELFDLEDPICKARNYAEAMRMIGSSDGMRGESGQAIEMMGQSLVLILRDLQSKREVLCHLAFKLKGGEA